MGVLIGVKEKRVEFCGRFKYAIDDLQTPS